MYILIFIGIKIKTSISMYVRIMYVYIYKVTQLAKFMKKLLDRTLAYTIRITFSCYLFVLGSFVRFFDLFFFCFLGVDVN